MSTETIARRTGSVARALDGLLIWRHPRLWLAYSIAFGVVGPIVTFAIATSAGMFGLATLPLDIYVLTAVLTMTAWLAFGRHRAWLHAVASGVFISGAIFALPFALFFGFFGLGLLGVSIWEGSLEAAAFGFLGVQPLLAFVAYSVNVSRAWSAFNATGGLFLLTIGGCIAPAVAPIAAWLVLESAGERAENAVLWSNRPLAELRLGRWRYLAPNHDWPALRRAYEATAGESMPEAPQTPYEHRLAEAFEQMTGRTIYFDFGD